MAVLSRLDALLEAIELVERLLPVPANRVALRRIVARCKVGRQRIDARLQRLGKGLVAIELRLQVLHAPRPVRLIFGLLFRRSARRLLVLRGIVTAGLVGFGRPLCPFLRSYPLHPPETAASAPPAEAHCQILVRQDLRWFLTSLRRASSARATSASDWARSGIAPVASSPEMTVADSYRIVERIYSIFGSKVILRKAPRGVKRQGCTPLQRAESR